MPLTLVLDTIENLFGGLSDPPPAAGDSDPHDLGLSGTFFAWRLREFPHYPEAIHADRTGNGFSPGADAF